MFLLKFLRENLDLIVENCKIRNSSFDKEAFIKKEKERLNLLKINENKKALMNKSAKQIGIDKKTGKNIDSQLQKNMKTLSNEIKDNDEKLRLIDEEVKQIALSIPNLVDEKVPKKLSVEDNEEVKKWETPPEFTFPPLDHVSILEKNDWVDFEKAAILTGSRFAILKGEILKLQRALISFFIHENLKKGYLEIAPPSIVNSETLIGTGQLPKLKEDIFFLGGNYQNWALIPTGEVPLTNLYRDSILSEKDLPINLTAHTPCFRSEAGAAGKDTKGLIRLHEFSKVELVKIVHPDKSEEEHQKMVGNVEDLLQKLKLPYRIMLLCSGDLGFSAKKCYDLEVWLPSQETYREISSCSNCGEFQAQRMKTRFRNKENKISLVHTLNGSALPIGRTLVAIIENYQNKSGTIEIPEVLKKFYF